MKQAFTLIEMLLVIAIIAILTAASLVGYAGITRAAQRAKCQELVANVATALTAMLQEEGSWPKRIAREGAADGRLDAATGYPLVRSTRYLTLSGDSGSRRLIGLDRFGIVTPWAAAVIKNKGSSASDSLVVSVSKRGKQTVADHVLHFAVDDDGDGVIKATVGGEAVEIRASAAVWCGGRDGYIEKYSDGIKKDDVYSWTPAQTRGN